MFKNFSYVVIGQGFLSILNLALGFAFVKFSSKEAYASYSQLLALVFFSTCFQASIVNSPAVALTAKKDGIGKVVFTRGLLSIQLLGTVISMVLLGLIATIFPDKFNIGNLNSIGVILFIGFVGVSWYRDFYRNQLFIDKRISTCFWVDVLYVGAFLILISVLYFLIGFELDCVLASLVISGAITLYPAIKLYGVKGEGNFRRVHLIFLEIWPISKWMLLTGVAAWVYGNGFVFVSDYALGPDGTADIVAARLFCSPLGMIFLALSNLYRPQLANFYAKQMLFKMKRYLIGVVFGAILVVLIYLFILLFVYPSIEMRFLAGKYVGLFPVMALWGVFFLLGGLSNIAASALLVIGGAKVSFFSVIAGSLLSMPIMYFLALSMGSVGVLIGMLVGQGIPAIYNLIYVRKFLNSRL